MHPGIRFTGLPVEPHDAMFEWMRRVLRGAKIHQLRDGGELHDWRDKSRFGLIAYTDAQRELRCVTPYFEGKTKVRARKIEIEPVNDCPYCDLIAVTIEQDPDNAPFSTPIRFRAADIAWLRSAIERWQDLFFCISAWAREVTIHPNEEALLSAHRDDPRMPNGDFVRPVGPKTMLVHRRGADGGPARDSMIFMTAVVERARERTESITGSSFLHCVAQSAGAEFDVVLAGDRKPLGPVRRGAILEGWFYLTGTVSRVTA